MRAGTVLALSISCLRITTVAAQRLDWLYLIRHCLGRTPSDVAQQGTAFESVGTIDPGTEAKTRMSKIRAYVLVFAALLYGNLAYAHPQLRSADPAAGAGIASPKEIRITFNEPVIARFSGVELKDQTGKLIATGKSEADAANKKILIVPVKEQLAPGAYSIEWHAVSEDTHRVKGSYSFSVTP